MARTYKSLINHNENKKLPEVKIEADVIITCVILGMAGTRYYQRQPFSYDMEYEVMPKDKTELAKSIGREAYIARDEYGRTPEDIWHMNNAREQQNFFTVMACMQDVLDRFEGGMGAWLKDRQSQKEGAGELITGREGGAGLTGPARDKEPRSWQTKALLEKLKNKEWAVNNNIYTGRGAYIGIWDDEVGISYGYRKPKARNTRPPLRVFRKDRSWKPTRSDTNDGIPWGVLGGKNENEGSDEPFRNLRPLGNGGMGPFPNSDSNNYGDEKVGYIHGMSSAIHRCAIHGAWSTPYEVTVGDDTTKISSCLACTTYMYALGYPPSSAHLGRGESWVPPISGDKFAIEKTSYPENVAPAEVITAPNFYQESICDRYEKNWSRDIHSYMNLGVYIIFEGEKRQKAILDETLEDGPTKVEIEPIPVIADTHKGSLNTLSDFLNTKPKRSVSSISTRFLDALTVHDSDWKRVRRTFLPLYDRKRVKELILSGLVRKKS